MAHGTACLAGAGGGPFGYYHMPGEGATKFRPTDTPSHRIREKSLPGRLQNAHFGLFHHAGRILFALSVRSVPHSGCNRRSVVACCAVTVRISFGESLYF